MEDRPLIQQGDCILVPVDSVPENAKEAENKTLVLEGEFTGHAHRLTGEGAMVLEARNNERFIIAPEGTVIDHEEHGALELPPGTYKLRQVREVDHFEDEIRNVMD